MAAPSEPCCTGSEEYRDEGEAPFKRMATEPRDTQRCQNAGKEGAQNAVHGARPTRQGTNAVKASA